jgi:DNA polymerase-3 subunit delta'
MPFRDVIGHRRLVGLLARAVKRGSLPPSLILAGPAGVGKRLVAISTAQSLNCRAGGTPALEGAGKDACGICPACTRIARGVHPDVILVEPGESGSIKVNQVRDVIDRAGYRPFEGMRRAVIIDAADALVEEAQNALLKTLEEPPPSSVFMLVTARPDLLLPTVLSRCPRLTFRPLGADEMAARARAIAQRADSGVREALEAETADLNEAREAAGRALAQAAATSDPRQRIQGSKVLLAKSGRGGAADREQLAMHLRVMASLVRDVELLSTSADRGALANPGVVPSLERLSAYRGEGGIRAFTAIDQALVALGGNAGVKAVADWVMLNL